MIDEKVIVDCTTGEVTTEPLDDQEIEQRADDREQSDEQVWQTLRAERNARLFASDWTQLGDNGADADAWATYRQQLRDLPSSTDDPRDPDWPESPRET